MSRHHCGRWSWQHENVAEFHLDYDVCPFCAETLTYRDQLQEKRENMHGVIVGYYPTEREEQNGD